MASASHAVAIVGGACAGAEAAAVLADHGISVVVFEQNARPFGKIEDGLPRWHDKQRVQEYEKLNKKLTHANVHFVPLTRLGRDLDFVDLISNWGFSAVLLAHGAWKDRPLGLPGVDDHIGRGLIYQNAFIHWFNHYNEKAYDGPHYHPADDAIVVGGGLASIDVVKALMLETVGAALARRGIAIPMLTLERKGVAAVLKDHQLDLDQLGLRGCCLYYRRRIKDMPLIGYKEGATPEDRDKTEHTRMRLVEMAMAKYLFRVEECRLPVAGVYTDGKLTGLRFVRTQVNGGGVTPLPDTEYTVSSPLTVSSIGSIPEPLAGIPIKGEFYRFNNMETGELEGFKHVFGVGNVVLGKGNISVSRHHSKAVADHVAHYLGIGQKPESDPVSAHVLQAERIARIVEDQSGLSTSQMEEIHERVRHRQRQVGYDGDYRAWIQRMTPPDLE